jgi:hypothetical protein
MITVGVTAFGSKTTVKAVGAENGHSGLNVM